MIRNNALRVGNFTSSEIVALTYFGKREMTKDELEQHKKDFPKSSRRTIDEGFSKGGLTYIEQTNQERRLGRSVDNDVYAKPLLWGNLIEVWGFDKLSLDYTLCSQETIVHPNYPFWAGSADGLKHDEGKTVIEIKSPYTLDSFCTLVKPLYDGLSGMEAMNWIRKNHKCGQKYYWQCVSNSILHNTKWAELIVFLPYESELKEIRDQVEGAENYYWFYYAKEGELPCLPDNGYYKNISIIRFPVPEEDKNFLLGQVIKAGQLLINN